MSNVEVLKDLHERKLLKPLVVSGIVPVHILNYLEMYYHVDAQVKTGSKKTIAVCFTACAFKVEPTTVWRALKMLNPKKT